MIRVFSIVLTIAFVLSIGCSSSVTVKTDYDPGKDFAGYKTYQWYSGKQPDDALSRNPLTKKRIISSIDKVLKEKGFELVESEEADFAIKNVLYFLHRIVSPKALILSRPLPAV